MKKIFKLLLLLVVLGMSTSIAWAGSDYYAKLKVSTPNSIAQGKVYAQNKSNAAGRKSEYTGTGEENKTIDISATAVAQDKRYAFYKWEFVAASGSGVTSLTDDKANKNPITLSLKCPSSSKDNASKASSTELRAIFYRPGGVTVNALTFKTTTHGKYSVSSIAKTGVTQTTYAFSDIKDTEKSVSNVVAGMPIDCKATPDDGYIFYSYYSLDKYGNKAYIGDLLVANQVLLIEDDVVKIGAEFTDNAFRIGDTFVKTLDDALQAVKQSPVKTIQVVRSHAVAPGYYTIPSDVSLLIPMDVDQQDTTGYNVERIYSGSTPSQAYKTLTLVDGVHIDCMGTIELGCLQDGLGQGAPGVGRPGGDAYGYMIMNAGSSITLNAGAHLYAWGFITGNGEIDVRRGASVREMFQMCDWRGGTAASTITSRSNCSKYKVFPVTQYFIQNIEVPTIYHPGAQLTASSAVFVSGSGAIVNGIGLIGIAGRDNAMFLMSETADSEDTWIRKYYDVASDKQCYEVNNSASLGSLVFEVYVTMDSRNYVLPITHNMKIRLLSGDLNISQDTELLPGAEIEVDKKATVTIAQNQSLYLYDSLQWAANYVFSSQFASRIKYRPGGQPDVRTLTAAGLGDAKLNIHGTFDVKGSLFTTEDGARIFSSNEDAGTIRFSTTAPSKGVVLYQCENNAQGWPSQNCTPAILRNADPNNPTYTAGTPAGQSYCYMNGKWTMLTVDPDNSCFVYDQDGVYYAKPGEYVPIHVTKDPDTKKITGNDDHTFSDADGAGRLFILMDGCQWWEVENVDNLYHCIHPLNDTYYFWEEGNEEWMEKRFAISWKDWDGNYLLDADDEKITYYLPYGVTPKFLGTNPTREADIDYTYDFEGWSPEFTPVKGDQTYTAKYKKTQVKYEIVFKYQEGIKQGSIISRQFLARDENPEVPTLYPIEGYESYSWSPAIAAVTGDQVYEAKWLESRPKEYEITFVDYDGKTVLKRGAVGADVMPTPPANPTGKPATSEYTYVFDHWSPALAKATEAKIYTAVYREVDRTYPVRFFRENGSTQIGETLNLPLGATPVAPAYSKDNTAQFTYSLEWIDKATKGENEDEWVKSVRTVTGPADYVAYFNATTNKYTVSVKSNPAGACVITGAGVYDYDGRSTDDTKITITVTPNAGYEDPSWNDGALLGDPVDGKYVRVLETLTGDVDLAINFTYDDPSAITTTWMSEDGTVTLKTVGQKNGTSTTYTGTTPTKEATAQYTYKFDGWTTAPNGGGTYYKNGLTPKATENATYYAHFNSTVNQYKVTLVPNPAGAGVLTGAGTFDYNSASTAVTAKVASYNDANYSFDGWYNGNTRVSTELSYSTALIANLTLTAKFTEPTYTITWKSEDGNSTIETDGGQVYGAKTTFNGGTPTKLSDDTYTYTFNGWTTEPNGEGLFYSNGATPTVKGNTTYYVHFNKRANDLTISTETMETLEAPVVKSSLVLTSNGVDASGQLIGSEYLSLQSEAHFDFAANAKNHKWYSVAVPWPVNAENGISVNGRTLVLGKDFDIIYYDGATRAAEGKNKAWKYVERDADKTLQPGRLYMIGLMSDAETIRFTKKAGTNLLTTTTNVVEYPASVAGDANWNGIANPALFHAYVNAGSEGAKAQYYISDEDRYDWFELSAKKLVVGEAVFVQAPEAKSIVVSNGGSYAAPRREKTQETMPSYDVRIIASGASRYADHIGLQVAEEKEDTYTIGQDLLKFGVSTKVAQMWVNRYDEKLCVNTVERVNETAEYPLGIYAPKAGEYTLYTEDVHDEYIVYLTRNGEAVWNLSDAPYTLDMNAGTDKTFGLRLTAKKAPQVATGMDEAVVNAQGETRKVLINNQVFIIRGNNVYTAEGQLVK